MRPSVAKMHVSGVRPLSIRPAPPFSSAFVFAGGGRPSCSPYVDATADLNGWDCDMKLN